MSREFGQTSARSSMDIDRWGHSSARAEKKNWNETKSASGREGKDGTCSRLKAVDDVNVCWDPDSWVMGKVDENRGISRSLQSLE